MDNAAAGPSGRLRLPENIAVIGLGIIGSFTALAILQRAPPSCHVTIYEVRPAPATIGGALNISPNAHRVMAKLGVSPKRYGGATPYVLFQNDQGKGIGVLKYGGEGDRWAEGYEGMRVQRNDIQNDLLAALRDYEQGGRLKILFDKRAIAIEETLSDVRLTFKDGEVSSYDLVIGADGIHSFTRSHVVCRTSCPAAPETTSMTEVQEGTRATPKAKYSGVTTIYGLVPTSKLDSCLLAPLDTHQSIRTISPHAGLFAISYARSDKSVIHWFSSRSPPVPPSPDTPEPSPDAVRNQLLETYATFPEPIPALIKATEKIYYWPVYRLAPIPEVWYSEHGRVVLVGDAAHAMPPHAAQGVGMGVEDALFVARIIAKLCTQSDAGKDRLAGIVQPSAKLWKREYHEKRLARIKHFVAHAEAQGRARMDAACTFVGRAREWALWAALPAINALAWVHGRSVFISTVLRLVGLGDVQGWGYDPDQEVICLDGL